MPIDRTTRESLRPLAAVAREHLARWHVELVAEHGAEGGKVVDTIAGRGNVTLPWMRSRSAAEVRTTTPSPEERAVLDASPRR